MSRIAGAICVTLQLAAASLSAQAAVASAASAIGVTTRTTPPTTPPPQSQTRAGSTNFTGSVRVQYVFQATAPGRSYGADVTFEPGARTAWHTHPAGQTLIVVAGVGRVQQWGDTAVEIRLGDVVHIPPGIKHWRGASPDARMTHLAISEPVDGKAVEWMEPVSAAQYGAPARNAAQQRPPIK